MVWSQLFSKLSGAFGPKQIAKPRVIKRVQHSGRRFHDRGTIPLQIECRDGCVAKMNEWVWWGGRAALLGGDEVAKYGGQVEETQFGSSLDAGAG